MDLFGNCCSPASSNSSNSKTVMTKIEEKVEPERGEQRAPSARTRTSTRASPTPISFLRSGVAARRLLASDRSCNAAAAAGCAASDCNKKLTHGPPFGVPPLGMLCPRTCSQPRASIHHFIRIRPRACPRQCPRLRAGLLPCQQSVAGCSPVPLCTAESSCVVHYKHLRRVINPRDVCNATAI
jgi:hypothetical protein